MTTLNRVLPGALTTILCLMGLATPEQAVESETPRRANVALTASLAYMNDDPNHLFTTSEAQTLARRFDLVFVPPGPFAQHVGAMRSAAPGTPILAYSNAGFAPAYVANQAAEEEFAHAVDGSRVISVQFGLNLMQPTSVKWQTRAVNECVSRMNLGNYDGCLLDMLTMAGVNPNYVSKMPAIPGSTPRRAYTEQEWQQAMVTLAREVTTRLNARTPDPILIGNTVVHEERYWDYPVTTQPIANVQGGAQMEDLMRTARESANNLPVGDEWLDNVRVIQDFEADGRTGLFSTKLWAADNTPALVRQWNAYTMASFLLAANGLSYYAFTPSRDKWGALGTNHAYRMPENLGAPRSGMFQRADGVYARNFANGKVLVNPTWNTRTVPLGATFTTLDGNRVSSVTLAPRTAHVLTGPS